MQENYEKLYISFGNVVQMVLPIIYVVCCARSYNQTNSVHRELRNKYSGEMLANEDWFRVIKTNNPNWLEERDQIAETVVNKLLYYIDLEK